MNTTTTEVTTSPTIWHKPLSEWLIEEAGELQRAPSELDAIDALLDSLGIIILGLQLHSPANIRSALMEYQMSQRKRGRDPLLHEAALLDLVNEIADNVEVGLEHSPLWDHSLDVHSATFQNESTSIINRHLTQRNQPQIGSEAWTCSHPAESPFIVGSEGGVALHFHCTVCDQLLDTFNVRPTRQEEQS